MDDPVRQAERLMPWEFRHSHTPDPGEILLRDNENSFWRSAAMWPLFELGPLYYFPPRH